MILEPDTLTSYRINLTEFLDDSNITEAAALAPKISSGRIAQILPEYDNDVVIPFIEQLDEKHAADILVKLPREMSAEILRILEPEVSLKLIGRISVDDAVDIIALLNEDEGAELLKKVHPDLEKDIRNLMHYKEGTVGSVMNIHYVAVRDGATVGETLQALSVSIRSIALGEVRISQYLKAAQKEIIVGLVNGLALGTLFTVIAVILQGNSVLGMVAGIALGCNVLLAGLIGVPCLFSLNGLAETLQ